MNIQNYSNHYYTSIQNSYRKAVCNEDSIVNLEIHNYHKLSSLGIAISSSRLNLLQIKLFIEYKSESEVAQSCQNLCNPMDCSPPFMGFSRQEYWSGLPFPSPGDLSDQGIDQT